MTDSRILFPDEGPNEWDNCIIGGRLLPGIVEVNCEPSVNLDTQKGHGKSGAKVIYRGVNPTKVTVQLQMWTSAQMAYFEEVIVGTLMPDISKVKGNAAQLAALAVDIVHPVTKLWRVKSVIFDKATGPKRVHGIAKAGAVIVTLHFIESRKQSGEAKKIEASLDGPTAYDTQTGKPSLNIPEPGGLLF